MEEYARVAVQVGRLLSAVALPCEYVVGRQARHVDRDGLGPRGGVRRPTDVGEDAEESVHDTARGDPSKTPCSSDLVTATQGARDADKATAAARAEGFPTNAVVFLDIERMETIPPSMRDYYRAWAARMLANKLYRPGIYAHEHNAAAIFDDMRNTFAAAGDTTTPRFWVAGGKGFDTGRAPQDVGFAFAGVWQGVIDVARSVANVKLPVDLNVASWNSPSESGIETQ